MRTLLEDLRRAATPLEISSRDELATAIKSANVALLRAALLLQEHEAPRVDPEAIGTDAESSEPTVDSDGDESPPEEDPNIVRTRMELRRYALWLEELALADELPPSEASSALNLSANLYEFVGRLGLRAQPTSLFHPPLSDLVRSAIVGSLTPYQAQSALIARRAREALGRLNVKSTAEQLHRQAALAVVHFLGREFLSAYHEARGLREAARRAADEALGRKAAPSVLHALDLAAATGLACGTAAIGMLVGADVLLRSAAATFQRVEQNARASGDADMLWLGNRLARVTGRMSQASMHSVLYAWRVPLEYRRALAREGVLEFWRPQLEAIEKGLLDPGRTPNFVVSIPTGAGKTLIAEMAILTALREGSKWALYVTPSRALAGQVSYDLRRRLEGCGITVRTMLAGAELNAFSDEEVDLISRARSVTVTTPEKLDAYLRNYPEFFDSCALAIFDEAHKISDATRGAVFESLVTRFLVMHPSTQIVLLSGVVSNHEELASWLGAAATATVVERRRPTRQVRGVAVRHDLRPGDTYGWKGRIIRRVDFSGGVALVHEDDDLRAVDQPLDVQLPGLFVGHYTERQYPRTWRHDREGKHTSVNDHAAALARVLVRTAGATLVFVQTIPMAESWASRFHLEEFDAYPEERGRLAEFVAAELGRDHDLVGLCRRGVAYHHARLPSSVQRAIELGLEDGWLKIVFATPTLREGVNTTATNVILAGDTYWDDASEARTAIAEPDFENLAGRAGRPFHETEGRIVLVPDSLALAQAIAAGKRYLLVGEEALRARSQLASLARLLEGAGGDMRRLPPASQSLLLGLTAAGLDDADKLLTFFEQSLWTQQETDDDLARDAVGWCADLFRETRSLIGEEDLQLAARTGLSLSSALLLRQAFAERLTDFSRDIDGGWDLVLPTLLEANLGITEVRRGALDRKVQWDAHLEPLRAWIGGQSYHEVRAAAIESGIHKSNAKVSETVKYCADVSTWLSWGFGASYTILQSLTPEVDQSIGILPLLTKYGVPSRAAAYMSLLGITDRSAAVRLAKQYEQAGGSDNINDIAAWLERVDDRLETFFPESVLRTQLLRRQVFGSRRARLPYAFTRFRVAADLRPGDTLFVRREGERVIAATMGDEPVGAPLEPELVVDFAEGDLTAISAVVVSVANRPAADSPATVNVALVRDLVRPVR